MKTLCRRTFLHGAGAAIALPWLEAMAGRSAQAAGGPKRYLSFFMANGYIRKDWVPSGGETDFQLPRSLAPLQPHRDDIIVFDGLDVSVATSGPGDDHSRGMVGVFTGRRQNPGAYKGGGFATGPSIDQVLVAKLKPNTRFPSLELGAGIQRHGTALEYLCYAGNNRPIPVETNPAAAFTRIFAGGTGDAAAASVEGFMRLQAGRKSILDTVLGSYQRLRDRVGGADREKVDAHLEGLRDLERRIGAATPPPIDCRPQAPAVGGNYQALVSIQIDLMVRAMSCDLTRVGTLQWQRSAGNQTHPWLGVTRGHHDLSHDPDSNTGTQEQLTKVNTWYAERFGELLGKLKAVREGAGTLLDNTVVIWGNELARGNSHNHRDTPFIWGGRGGGVRTGRFLKYPRVSHNDLLVSVLNTMGVPDTTFGDPAHCTGPLRGLT